MPFDLCYDPTGFVPGRRLILEFAVDALHTFWWTTHGAAEQKRNPAFQNGVLLQPDGVEVTFRFQRFIEVRNGEGGISPKEPHQITVRVSRDDWL